MESSKEKRLYERQKQEMEAIENELANVRTQYHKICRERGTAHLTAQLVQKQEEEMLEFESRRDRLVRARAEKVAREKEKEIKAKSLKEEAKKKELIERRKDIFNRDWNPDTESTSVKKVQDRVTKRQEIESQLRKLAEMEKSLEEKIRGKKNQRPGDDKTQKEVPVYDVSSSSSDDSEEVDPHFVGRYVRSRGGQSHPHHHHHGTKPGTCPERRSDSGFLETDLMTDPDVIAKNVLLKLERMKDQMRKTIEAVVVSSKTQVFKDTAINTTKPEETVSRTSYSSVADEEHPSGTSSSSSYKSLPKVVQPKKREFATLLQKLKEQCLNDRQVEGGDFTSPGSSDSDDFSERVQSLIESSGIQRYMGHSDRMQFWNEVCQEAGTILHEETAAALANMTDHSGKVPSSNVSKNISKIEEVDLASGSESPTLDHSKPGQSTPKKLTSSQHSSANTIKGILEERSLTFASSFSSDEE